MLSDNFFLKNKLTVMQLARDFLVTEPEQQVKTINYYEEKLNVSRGTIQSAMVFLTEQGCITTHFRGYLGTFLVSKNQDKLWEYSGYGALMGAMALPLNSLVSGLATGICDCMKDHQVSFNCAFIQGSRTRLEGLMKGKYDFIIASKLTEVYLQNKYPDVEKVMDLPNCAYGGRYILYFSSLEKDTIADGMTIAVDPASLDQVHLTKCLIAGKKNIKILETTYINTRNEVQHGNADVTVARQDTVVEGRQEYCRDLILPGLSRKEMDDFSTSIVLSTKDNYGIEELVNYLLVPKQISRVQKDVVNKVRVPSYY